MGSIKADNPKGLLIFPPIFVPLARPDPDVRISDKESESDFSNGKRFLHKLAAAE